MVKQWTDRMAGVKYRNSRIYTVEMVEMDD